jgi:hypothetical protein
MFHNVFSSRRSSLAPRQIAIDFTGIIVLDAGARLLLALLYIKWRKECMIKPKEFYYESITAC